jgi:SAM-dependent methyltransferase
VGADLNRKLFAAHGADPANVIQADFFDPALQERYRGWFDVVVSRGFIEHFHDVEDVIRKHLNLLRSGGLLVVAIPNLRGINKPLSALFHREALAMHNQNIMTRERFASLFPSEQAERLFCGYYGTFSFYLFSAPPGSPMRVLLAACMKVQPVLNSLFRLLLEERGAESRWFSPTLLFLGVKR